MKLDEDARLNIQDEIIQFLADRYYNLNVDPDEAHETARHDSYKVMAIIEKGLAGENRTSRI